MGCNYVDLLAALKTDTKCVVTIDLQFGELILVGLDGLFPTILQLPAEHLLLHLLQL